MAFSKVSDFEMGFNVKVDGVDKTILQMHGIPPEVRKALEQTISKEAVRIRERARAMASGEVLNEDTGRYVASIKSTMRSDSSGVFGDVYSDDPRVNLFEYGGSTPARDILPNVAKALAFAGGSVLSRYIGLGSAGTVFAAVVHRPVVQYPKRSVIHAAFDESRGPVVTEIGDALVTGLDNAGLDHNIDSAAKSIIIDHGA